MKKANPQPLSIHKRVGKCGECFPTSGQARTGYEALASYHTNACQPVSNCGWLVASMRLVHRPTHSTCCCGRVLTKGCTFEKDNARQASDPIDVFSGGRSQRPAIHMNTQRTPDIRSGAGEVSRVFAIMDPGTCA